MKNFLKQNWFKIGILSIVGIIGFSLSYYLAIFLPQKNEQEARDKIISQYRKACEATEEFNQKSVIKAMNDIGINCSRTNISLSDQKSCFDSASAEVADSSKGTLGEDAIQKCIKYKLDKYGTGSF